MSTNSDEIAKWLDRAPSDFRINVFASSATVVDRLTEFKLGTFADADTAGLVLERVIGYRGAVPVMSARERAIAAAAWDEAIQAAGWASTRGTDPLAYVAHNNPYRAAENALVVPPQDQD